MEYMTCDHCGKKIAFGEDYWAKQDKVYCSKECYKQDESVTPWPYDGLRSLKSTTQN